MENAVTLPTIPELDETDVVAIEGILIRTVRAQEQVVHDREQVKILNARITSNTKIRAWAYEALKIFGFEEPPEDELNLWDVVRQAIGPERYRRATALALGEELPLLEKMGDDQPPAGVVAEGIAFGDTAEGVVVKPSIPVRAAILEYLQAAGEQGVKAAQVRQYLADAHGLTVHEKTPGMTLYRLLKEGLVRREGRTWFAKAQEGNNENEAPSGIAAGASEPR